MPLSIGSDFPQLTSATEWINDHNIGEEFLGQPCVVQFWALSCPVCKMNLPHLQHLLERYSEQGLRLVSVHMPRMESDTDVKKVQAAIEEVNLTGPCAIDNNHTIGDLFQTGGVWPCYFLFDAEGKLRSRAAGALGLKMAENSLKRMLGTPNEETALVEEAR